MYDATPSTLVRDRVQDVRGPGCYPLRARAEREREKEATLLPVREVRTGTRVQPLSLLQPAKYARGC